MMEKLKRETLEFFIRKNTHSGEVGQETLIKTILNIQEKAEMFELLKKVYNEYNEKHFGELCGNLLETIPGGSD